MTTLTADFLRTYAAAVFNHADHILADLDQAITDPCEQEDQT